MNRHETASLLGARIETLRIAAAMTRRELSDGAGICIQNLWRAETGLSVPNTHTLREIARVIGCRVSDIVSCLDEAPGHASARGAGGQGVDASATREDARQAQESLSDAAPGHVGS